MNGFNCLTIALSLMDILDFILVLFTILVGVGILISLWNLNIALRIYIDRHKSDR